MPGYGTTDEIQECRQEIERLREQLADNTKQYADLVIKHAAIEETRKIRDEIVPDLRDFKWLDAECHAGCQSLVWKRERDEAVAKLAAIRTKLESIVCTDENFPGVLKLSHKSTVHKETIHGVEFAVCDNEYLSPLGDALIELWQMSGGVVSN